uniref:Regulatory protein zeste n=1 Tax=Diabrotica virgifera virgifera TaxID=50390 RepID=A0A6P7G8K5_DIAVI
MYSRMEEKKRCVNFTYDEKLKLAEFIKQHPVLLNKKTDGATNKAKDDAWEVLTAKFNSGGSIKRSSSSLKKIWNRMKSESKIYKAKLRINLVKTGGGSTDEKKIHC